MFTNNQSYISAAAIFLLIFWATSRLNIKTTSLTTHSNALSVLHSIRTALSSKRHYQQHILRQTNIHNNRKFTNVSLPVTRDEASGLQLQSSARATPRETNQTVPPAPIRGHASVHAPLYRLDKPPVRPSTPSPPGYLRSTHLPG